MRKAHLLIVALIIIGILVAMGIYFYYSAGPEASSLTSTGSSSFGVVSDFSQVVGGSATSVIVDEYDSIYVMRADNQEAEDKTYNIDKTDCIQFSYQNDTPWAHVTHEFDFKKGGNWYNFTNENVSWAGIQVLGNGTETAEVVCYGDITNGGYTIDVNISYIWNISDNNFNLNRENGFLKVRHRITTDTTYQDTYFKYHIENIKIDNTADNDNVSWYNLSNARQTRTLNDTSNGTKKEHKITCRPDFNCDKGAYFDIYDQDTGKEVYIVMDPSNKTQGDLYRLTSGNYPDAKITAELHGDSLGVGTYSVMMWWDDPVVTAGSAATLDLSSIEKLVQMKTGRMIIFMGDTGADTSVYNSDNYGFSWTKTIELNNGGNDKHHALAIDSNDNLVGVFIDTNSGDDIFYFNSTDGIIWSAKTGVSNFTGDAGVEWASLELAVDANDNFHMCAVQGGNSNDTVQYANYSASTNTWSNGTIVWALASDEPSFCDIAVNSSGDIFLAWAGLEMDTVHLKVDTGAGWGAADSSTQIFTIGSRDIETIDLEIDPTDEENIYINWLASGVNDDVYVANSSDSGQNWNYTIVEGNIGNDPSMAVDQKGNIHVIYLTGGNRQGNINWTNSTDGSATWSTTYLLNDSAQARDPQIRGGLYNNQMGGHLDILFFDDVPNKVYFNRYDLGISPVVTLTAPVDENTETDGNIIFSCEVGDLGTIKNISLFHNMTGTYSLNESYKNYVVAIDTGEDVWVSYDWGVTSEKINETFKSDITSIDDFAVAYKNYMYTLDGDGNVYSSTDEGVTWSLAASNYNDAEANNGIIIFGLRTNETIFIIEADEDVWQSPDQGVTWTKVNDDYNGAEAGGVVDGDVNSTGAIFIVDSLADVTYSLDFGVTWTKVNDDYNGGEANAATGITFVDDSRLLIANSKDIWESTDSGVTWAKINDLCCANALNDIASDGATVYGVSSSTFVLHTSIDNGTTWSAGHDFATTALRVDVFRERVMHRDIANQTFNFSINTSLSADTYEWNCEAFDDGDNGAIASANFTFTIGEAEDTTSPLVTINLPTNLTQNSPINFNISVNENSTANYTLDGGVTNFTMHDGSGDGLEFNATNDSIADGQYTTDYYVLDISNNTNFTESVTFIVDQTTPVVAILYPTNVTYGVAITEFNWSATDTNADTCWVYNSTDNETVTCGDNATIDTSGEGQFTMIAYMNDTAGNNNFTETITFIVDATNPAVTIDHPTNVTYNTAITWLNVTVTDTNLESCFYYNSTDNVTITCGDNATGIASTEGSVTYIFYSNDTAGNTNNTESVTFHQDTIQPALTILYPTNTTYTTNISEMNYSITDTNLESCLWSGDQGVTNSSITCGDNVTGGILNSTDGNNTWLMSANDTAGNFNTTFVTFDVTAPDTTSPLVTINQPENITYSALPIDFNVTTNENSTANYTLDGGVTNISMNNSGDGQDFIHGNGTLADGQYTTNYYVEDIAGNKNYSEAVTFLLDTTTPAVSILYPTNITYSVAITEFNWSATDTNPDTCWFYNSTDNVTLTCGNNGTIDTSGEGQFTMIAYMNDTAGNLNDSETITFIVDSTQPALTILYPANTTYATNITELNFSITDTNLETCMWSADSGVTNSTIVCGNNVTDGLINSTDGNNTWMMSANDTAGNFNTTFVFFTVTGADTTNPLVTINQPENITYSTGPILFNVSIDENSTANYSLDGGINNVTMHDGSGDGLEFNATNTSLADGQYVVDYYVLDIAGNSNNTESVTFILDTTQPALTILFPTNTTYSFNISELNFSITDTNLESCLWSADLGVTNNSITCGDNVTGGLINSTDGNNTWMASANDTAGNFNTTFVFFTITGVEAVSPLVTINNPANATFSSLPITFNISVNENSTANYTLDDGINNVTMHDGSGDGLEFNASNGSLADGQYIVSYYVTDISANNNTNNTESVTFILDTTQPALTILYPSNTTFNQNISELNYSITDTNLETCWWSADVGVTNNSITCGNNVTDGLINSTDGNNTWLMSANDTAGNINATFVYFTITGLDTTPPEVTINDPNNATFNSLPILFNLTTNEDATTAQYSLDGGITNVTMQNNGNRDFNATNTSLADGQYTADFYVNDTANNFNNTESVTFILDTVNPAVSIVFPTNITYSASPTDFNFTVSDTNLETCWFYNSSDNVTLTCGNNFTGLSLADGQYTLIAYANDTAGNNNFSEAITFLIDSTQPALTILYPTNTTYTINISEMNYSITDTNLESCLWSADQGTTNSTITCGDNVTGGVLNSTDGNNTWMMSANDTAGNFNTTFVFFTVAGADVTSPLVTINNPQNISFNTDPIFNISVNENSTANYTLDGGVTNFTMHDGSGDGLEFNATNASIADGQYTVNYYVEDIVGNKNYSESVTFIHDEQAPGSTIFFPDATDYSANVSGMNFTVFDTTSAVDSCFWSIDDGANNNSIDCDTNVSSGIINSTDGANTWYLYANDTAGNLQIDSVTFNVLDSTAPLVTINQPENITYNSLPILFNITVSESVTANYTLDGGINNVTLHNASLLEYNASNGSLADGQYIVNYYAIDISDEENRNFTESVTFILDTTQPALTILYPTNTTYTQNITEMNYSITDTNLETCLWSADYGVTNNSITCGNNVTDGLINSTDGNNTWMMSANDTAGNFNTTFVFFTVTSADTTPPYFTTIPGNVTITYGEGFAVTFEGADDNGFGSFVINWSVFFQINESGYLENSTADVVVGTHVINVTINDSSNNINWTLFSVTVNQATGNVDAFLNHSRSNLTMDNRTNTIDLNATLVNGLGDISLRFNGTLLDSGASPLFNNSATSVGSFNVTAIYAGNQNYTADSEVWFLEVTDFVVIPQSLGRLIIHPNIKKVPYIELNKSLDFTI